MRVTSMALVFTLLCACTETSSPASTQVRSKACDEKTEAYFAGPWPDDRRLIDGKVPTRRFPRPGTGSLILNMLETGDKVMTGWGTSSPVYVPFTGPINPASLPQTPSDSRQSNASVFITAIDPASPAFGQLHPVDFHFFDTASLYLPANVLAVRPFPGRPLEPKTTYALVVTTRVSDAGGAAVGPEEGFWNSLHGQGSDEVASKLSPVLSQLHLKSSDVAGAFFFTTQPILDELVTLRSWLEAQSDPPLQDAHLVSTKPTFTVFEGTYPAANLQHGETPFSLKGGDFQYDDAGTPIPAQIEQMRVALCVPKGPVPSAGFPVVIYSHGTGGSFESVINDICDELAQVGIAAVGIDQVFHGPRGGNAGGCFGMSVELCFFNPVNVVAGRNNARQAALDNVLLRKMLTQAQLPRDLDPDGRLVRFAADSVGFFGHSQGGLSGALEAAFDTHLTAAVLSGAGGHLTTTILVRKDPFDVKAFAEGPLILGIEGKESLDTYHPAVAFIQALAEVADPSNYGRHFVKQPQGHPKHLYLTSGLNDPYTSAFTAEVLAAAASVPQLTPVGRVSEPHVVAGLSAVSAPVQDDVTSDANEPVTAVFRQFPRQGHFPVFYDASARVQWTAFFDQALHHEPVRITSP